MRTIVLSLSCILTLSAQDLDGISDFYDYVNRDWIDSTEFSDRSIVINEAGLQWETVQGKSIAILADTATFGLNEQYLHTLAQLRCYYTVLLESGLDAATSFQQVQDQFPMIFGIVWSEIHYSPEQELKLSRLYEYTHNAYRHAIESSTWLDSYHQELFLNKLRCIELHSGAPTLTDYPKIPNLTSLSLAEMTTLINIHESVPQSSDIYWPTSPCEPHCFYQPGQNRIIINAGALLGLDSSRIGAKTFAIIGRTIAHEMTHAFDDIGEDYDETGRRIGFINKIYRGGFLRESPMDHNRRAIMDQYDQFTLGVGRSVSGKKTLLENHADIAGVEVSYHAFKFFLDTEYPDLSEEQRDIELRNYFIGYAQMWREISTDDFKLKTLERIHAPQKFRAIGPIYNQDDFYTLFDIDPISSYYIPADQRVKIW